MVHTTRDGAIGHAWVYFAVLVGAYLIYRLRNYIRIVIFVWGLRGPPAVPLLGNANVFYDKDVLHKMSHEMHRDYGRVLRVWMTCFPYVILHEPDDIQIVLGNPKHTEKIYLYRLLDNFIGKGLITREARTWKRHRRVLQPAFHRNVLEGFTESFGRSAARLANKFLDSHGKDVNITSFVNDTVYDILNETVLGLTREGREKQRIDDADLPFRKGQVFMPYRLMRPWLLIDWVYRMTDVGKSEEKQRENLFRACKRMMAIKREVMRSGDDSERPRVSLVGRETSLLEYMVEINEKDPNFTDEDIIDECCTFMLAGQESVSTATALTMFLLAGNQDWQEKCVQELEKIFGPDSRAPSMRDLTEMRCLEMCIKETLRLYPSVPLFARTLGEDVKIEDHVIPAGCGVIIMPYCTHRLPHHYDDPHAFDPGRFDGANSERRHPYAYLPFSAGPRNCIGYKFALLEMKAMISAVLRTWQLEPVPGKKEVQPKFRLTLRATGGLWVKMKKRTATQNIHPV
ncbi:probable cytochrome P450 4aa1 [Orussus abietinus]|uniref:probable cytochrome P450 4aa1 n=1 Tax=Orussus abietinus TaxID=222816 RepID=UPI0006266E57|nr:probable cytochrome P450 4aa1 [Orussus abietinus]